MIALQTISMRIPSFILRPLTFRLLSCSTWLRVSRSKHSLGLSLCLCLGLSHAQSTQDAAVELSALVQSSPARITLNWVANAGATQYTIARKLKNSSTWGANLATLPGDATTFTDTTAIVGSSYEYRVLRNAAAYTGYGYINSGIEVPLVESRGNLILVVDQTFAVSLKTEIDRWVNDAIGDGWRVTRIEADRNATAADVKVQIKAVYDNSSPKAKSVFILGHVPVPYSGQLNPDGHPDHVGAWPTDTYYADMNGTWTDNTVNTDVAGDPRNKNAPGDGKFDQSLIPSDVELQIGRVDFSNMPSFALSEEELLRNYLNKDHAFRQKEFTAISRGLVDDNFGYFSGEAFASSGFKNIGPIVGPGNVVSADYLTTMADSSYLWSYGCGGGWFQGAGGIGSSADFANSHTQSVFTMLFGSYFGDWDSQDNFLRAPLAQGLTLTNAWSGRPHWVFHQMALGENIGYCARVSQNNNATYFASYGARFVSIGLMGDPTLRNDMMTPASILALSNDGYNVNLTWEGSPENILGYNIYRKGQSDDDFVRVNDELVFVSSFTDSCVGVEGDITYMVRVVNLQVTPSGSYYNMSQGVMEVINHTGSAGVEAIATFAQNGQTISFQSNSTGPIENYLWIFGDGETSTEQNPVHVYNDGLWEATLIVSNACHSDTLPLTLLILTGVNDPVDDGSIVLSPNPTSGEFVITLKDGIQSPFDLQIIDANGKRVFEQNKVQAGESIRTTNLSKGFYTVLIKEGEQLFRKKLIVQ